MNNDNEMVDRLARVAYAAYVEAKGWDLDSRPMKNWPELAPECKDAWRMACELAEGIRIAPEAAAASVLRMDQL